MSGPTITLERAYTDELERVESLLEANGLPFEDVRETPALFLLAWAGANETTVVGAGGIEQYGSNGLLRSVVVDEEFRGREYGTVLCDKLEEFARSEGIETLYLLTTTASAFFDHRGYEEIPRDDAPPRIQRTTEFAALCPDSATCMKRKL